MKKPKMILFDYGQTLINEGRFDPLAGNEAVIASARTNPCHVDAHELQAMARRLSDELWKGMAGNDRNERLLELPAIAFDRYLYEYFGMEFDMDMDKVQEIFWDAACAGHLHPTEGIGELLDWLYGEGIRTAVVSNMMNSSALLERRIGGALPGNHFEFFLSSADYLFRKPHPLIFELALRKCGLPPQEVWFCGDNLICDIQGAYRAGMTPIFYSPYVDYEQAEPEGISYRQIENWSELRELIIRA